MTATSSTTGARARRLTDSQLRGLAMITFAACVVFYLIDGLVPLFARVAAGQGWRWGAGPLDTMLVVITALFPIVGVLIARREPRNAVAWIMLAAGVVASFPFVPYYEYTIKFQPGSLPAGDTVAAIEDGTWAIIIALIGMFLILLFPDGHLPSPRWRWVAWLAGITTVYVYLATTFTPGKLPDLPIDNPWGLSFLGGRTANLVLLTLVVIPISIGLCAAGLVVRFRRSTGIERQQLKWLTTAGAVVAVGYGTALLATLPGDGNWTSSDPTWLKIVEIAGVSTFALIPISIGVAILKHGLYDIDVVINKALVFGLLAGFITVVYVGIVVGVGHLAGRGDRPNIVLSIAATTFVAVAFQPVRERVERFANRLVYGRRATPYEVLSDFADRVGGAYDATALLPVMARTVAEGLDATRVEIWLTGGSGLLRDTSWPAAESTLNGSVPTTNDIVADRVVEVRHSGDLLGALAVTKPAGDSFRPAELKLLDDVAAQAGLVLRNVRLVEELRGSRERLMSSQDDERRRLERRLHDGAQQRLVTVGALINQAREQLGPDAGDSATALDQLAGQLQSANEELSELARGIHPAVLTDLGLGAAIQALADRAPVPVGVDVRLEQHLSRNVEATLYFVAAEALTNVAKYAHATSVVLTLSIEETSAVLEVVDDGIGGVDETRGSGVRGLRDRVAAVDGNIEISSPPGAGTRLRCLIPLTATVTSRTEDLLLAGRSGR